MTARKSGCLSEPARAMTTMPCKLPRLFDVDEVAQQIGVSTRTVGRWIKRGELHVHRLGRQLRIAEDDLMLFLIKNRK
jgi:excisionase family DNA binding protein